MKSSKLYNQELIGISDVASLTVRFPNSAHLLFFGEDGDYNAYIVDKDAEIGEHYTLALEGKYWVHIYDDDSLTFSAYAEEIKIYRAGSFGCIIQLIKGEGAQ